MNPKVLNVDINWVLACMHPVLITHERNYTISTEEHMSRGMQIAYIVTECMHV